MITFVRCLVIASATLSFAGICRAEVVIQNYNSAGQALSTSGTGKKFSVSFTVGTGQTVKLGAFAVFSSTTTTETNLDFTLTNGTTTYSDANLSSSSTTNSLGGPGSNMTYFNFLTAASTNIGFNTLSAGTWTLNVGGNGSNGLNQAYYYSTSNTLSFLNPPITSASETAYTGSNYMNFALVNNAIAVPEPSTLLLGCLATFSGGTGVWWKRRKKKATEQTNYLTKAPAL